MFWNIDEYMPDVVTVKMLDISESKLGGTSVD